MNFTKCLYHPNTGATLLAIASLLSIGGILAGFDMISAANKNPSVLFKNASTETTNFLHNCPFTAELSYGHILGFTSITLNMCLLVYSLYQFREKYLDTIDPYQPSPRETKKQNIFSTTT